MKSNHPLKASIKLGVLLLSFASMACISSCQESSINREKETLAIAEVLDQWHLAATEAHFDTYFNLMSDDAIFLGTDASETWDKKTFMNFALPHFDKAPAWEFTAHDRNIYFAADGQTAWFDELLNTWMDTCRGSGVLTKTSDGWKIKHYNLAILVPNDKVQDYLKVLHQTPTDSIN